MNNVAQQIADEYAKLPMVEAVALAGSRSGSMADSASDFDLYVYSSQPVPLEQRIAMASRRSQHPETDSNFWEPGDEWVEADGSRIDVMFRRCEWIEEQLERVLVRHEASIGYTTAFWFNVRRSSPLFDRSGWFRKLQSNANQPYPEALRRNIVAKNHPILRSTQSSYTYQIHQALQRADVVSANHRVAALLASFFDVLFAVNRQPHPGEKRLLRWTAELCPLRPPYLDNNVEAIIKSAAQHSPKTVEHIHRLLDGLDTILRAERLIQ